MALKLKTAATSYPLTLLEVKQQLRLPEAYTAEDDALNWYIKAATAIAERETNRALMSQTWELVLDRFPTKTIECSKNPLISIDSIKYIDTDGTEQTLDAENYIVDNKREPWRVTPAYGSTWPGTQGRINAVTITFTAGYASAAVLAEQLANTVQGMRLLIGDMYRNRENIVIGRIVSDIPRNAITAFHLDRLEDHHTGNYN